MDVFYFVVFRTPDEKRDTCFSQVHVNHSGYDDKAADGQFLRPPGSDIKAVYQTEAVKRLR